MNFRELWILKLKFKFEVIFAAKCHRLNTWILCTEMRKFMIIWSHNIGKFLPYCHRQQNSFLIIHFVCATGHKFLANFITSFSSGFCLGFFLLNFAQPLFQLPLFAQKCSCSVPTCGYRVRCAASNKS